MPIYRHTSPFFLCAALAEILPKSATLVNYMGLPTLWKAPVDFEAEEMRFWELADRFWRRERTFYATNNPLLHQQMRYQFGRTATKDLE